jgi:hypothetical protein
VLGIFIWSRAAIWIGALFALSVFQPNRSPQASMLEGPWFSDLGAVTDVWARFDSGWFLEIAEHGYERLQAAAFYPLYPGLVGVLGRVLGSHFILAGVLVSLSACLGSMVLLYRLAEERLGSGGARRAVLYLAVFPMTVFLQAVYGESLYLLLTLAAFLLAERGRFLGAGAAAGLALLTRAAGIALLPALALLAWRSPQRVRSLASLAIAPALFTVYPLVLWQQLGDAWAFVHVERLWDRHLSPAGPLGGLWHGLRAGWAGVQQLIAGPDGPIYWTAASTDPSASMRTAAINLEYLAYLMLFAYLTAVAWRRFGAPYGLFAASSLALPLSSPASDWPLLSLPRFGLAIFPMFLALAWIGARPRAHTAIVVVSAILLGITVAQWSLWQWVS